MSADYSHCAEHGTYYTAGCAGCRAYGAAIQRAMVARGKENPLPADDPRHGRAQTYTNHACRCDACRAAWATLNRKARRRRTIAPDDPRHGSFSTYTNYGCRCDACRGARKMVSS